MLTFDEIKNLAGETGLRTFQIVEFRAKFGANAMTPPVRESLWKQYLEKFDDPIIRILLLAVTISTIVSIIRGSGFLDTIGIILAILLATGIAFFNEYRSSREFDVLNAHRDDVAIKVVRDGHAVCVPSREIVAGDLILLEAGDAIAADGWMISADDFFSDESAFTGETEPEIGRAHV
jgi:Ca2+-transporting ATPase